jgi:Domain of unknown function (DUF4274)/Ankyrin repeats (3 copies)
LIAIQVMSKIEAKVAALFKKAYYYNWDNGLGGLRKIVQDKNCDLATAKMLFWHGVPGYYYNHANPAGFKPYEQEAFDFLQTLAQSILVEKYPVAISYAVEDSFRLADLGNIPAALAEPVLGIGDYQSILWPNKNPFQDQVFALCTQCASVEDMEALALAGADFSRKILNGYVDPIVVAVNYGQVEAVRYLADHGSDLKALMNKAPLLFGAVCNGRPKMVDFLLDRGVDPNQKDAKGNTALHYGINVFTADFSNLEDIAAALSVLIARGANKSALNSQKKTPLDLAKKSGNTLYENFLTSTPS